MSRSDWRFVIRDLNENRLGQLRHFNHATLIPRASGIGTWQIEVPFDAPGADTIAPGCGLIVYRDGKYVMSGPMRSYEEKWDSGRGQPVLSLAGLSDEYLLSTHVVFPNPNVAITNQTVAATRSVNAVAETAAKIIIAENMLNTAAPVADRFVQNFQNAPNQSRGASIFGSLRFDNILTWLQTAMPPAGLGFQVTYNQDDKYVFDVYVPNNFGLDIVFSRGQRNLVSYSYSLAAPDSTTVFVGGGGAGTARTFVKANNVPPYEWGYQQELFLDRRDTTNTSELTQAANDELFNSGQSPTSFSFVAKDTQDIKFGRDYNLGDRVGFRIRDAQFSDVVSAVQYDITPSSERVNPIIGKYDVDALAVSKVVKQLARRIGLLERRT